MTGADADAAADTREKEVTAQDGSCGGVEFALYVGVAWIRPYSTQHYRNFNSLTMSGMLEDMLDFSFYHFFSYPY